MIDSLFCQRCQPNPVDANCLGCITNFRERTLHWQKPPVHTYSISEAFQMVAELHWIQIGPRSGPACSQTCKCMIRFCIKMAFDSLCSLYTSINYRPSSVGHQKCIADHRTGLWGLTNSMQGHHVFLLCWQWDQNWIPYVNIAVNIITFAPAFTHRLLTAFLRSIVSLLTRLLLICWP